MTQFFFAASAAAGDTAVSIVLTADAGSAVRHVGVGVLEYAGLGSTELVDQIVSDAGTYGASATMPTTDGFWAASLVALKAGAPDAGRPGARACIPSGAGAVQRRRRRCSCCARSLSR